MRGTFAVIGFLVTFVGLVYVIGYSTHYLRMLAKADQIGILTYLLALVPIVLVLCVSPVLAFLVGCKIKNY